MSTFSTIMHIASATAAGGPRICSAIGAEKLKAAAPTCAAISLHCMFLAYRYVPSAAMKNAIDFRRLAEDQRKREAEDHGRAGKIPEDDLGLAPARPGQQHPENADRYNVAMRMNGAVYLCHASGPVSTFMGWAPGKQFPAQLDEKNKIMMVKSPNGETVELRIQKKKQ